MTGRYKSLCGRFTLLRMFKNFDGRVYVAVGANRFVKSPWNSFLKKGVVVKAFWQFVFFTSVGNPSGRI